MSSTTALIPIEHQVDLARVHEYGVLHTRMLNERRKFFKLYDSAMELAAQYLKELPESDMILYLRREIRIATRGTPATIAMDAVTVSGYVSMQTEALYNAQSHLVKNAWRLIAPLVHPDRGGSNEMFQTALAAYRLKDLTYLQDLYIQLQRDNLFWRCSKEGREYLDTEIRRPGVSLQRLRTRPEFQIVMLDRSGKKDRAREFASVFARQLIIILQDELNRLLAPEPAAQPKEGHTDGNEQEHQESSEEVPCEGQGRDEDRNDEDCGQSWSGA